MNQITEIPQNIGRLHQLKVLNLCANNLKSLPKELTKLKRLDTLDISFNPHLKLANEIIILKQMHWLGYINIAATNFDSASIRELQHLYLKQKLFRQLKISFLKVITDDLQATLVCR